MDQSLSLQSTLGSLGEVLPSLLRVAVHHLAEGTPEVPGDILLAARSRHVHLGTLEVRGNLSLLLSLDLSFKLSTGFMLLTNVGLFSGLGRVGTVRTEELVDIVSKHVGVGEHEVHGTVLLMRSLEAGHDIIATVDLLNQSVLNGTCIGVQQCRGFSTKVLKDLKTFVADSA